MATTNFLAIVTKIKSVLRKQPTVPADKVHKVFLEPGILGGYRLENKSFLYYFKSVFQIHNETVNIWSHVVGFCVVLYNMVVYGRELQHFDMSYMAVVMTFGVCCLIYTGLSSFAHTFHSVSPFVHQILYEADYAGIGFYSLGSSILLYYCSCHHEYYPVLEHYFLPLNAFLSWFGFACSCISKLIYHRPYPFQRKMWNICSFGVQVCFTFYLVILRFVDCAADDSCLITSMKHHKRVVILVLISMVFFSCEIPEKKLPGKFDIVGHGHQIFHILIVIANIEQFAAANADIHEYSINKLSSHRPCVYKITLSVILYALAVMVTFSVLPYFTRKSLEVESEKDKMKLRKTE